MSENSPETTAAPALSARQQELKSFKERVAKAIIKITQATSMSSALRDTFRLTGITGTPVHADGSLTVEITDKDVQISLPSGFSRSDFTPDAMDAIELKTVNRFKHTVWMLFMQKATYGYWNEDLVVEELKALGYTSLPVEKTEVSVTIRTDAGAKQTSFTLDGSHKGSDIKAKLLEVTGETEVVKAVKAAFPEAAGLPSPVSVSANVVRQWPATSEFDTASRK